MITNTDANTNNIDVLLFCRIPLCISLHHSHFFSNPHAWPKLWKHHGAQAQVFVLYMCSYESESTVSERMIHRL